LHESSFPQTKHSEELLTTTGMRVLPGANTPDFWTFTVREIRTVPYVGPSDLRSLSDVSLPARRPSPSCESRVNSMTFLGEVFFEAHQKAFLSQVKVIPS